MNIEYRRLTENDLDIFMELRMQQLQEEGAHGRFALYGLRLSKERKFYVLRTLEQERFALLANAQRGGLTTFQAALRLPALYTFFIDCS